MRILIVVGILALLGGCDQSPAAPPQHPEVSFEGSPENFVMFEATTSAFDKSIQSSATLNSIGIDLGGPTIKSTLLNPTRWNYRNGAPPNGSTTEVGVCWEMNTLDLAKERKLAQQAVETSWERIALIDFTGWDDCKAKQQPGIHIRTTSNKQASVIALGNELDGVDNGLELNIAKRDWSGTACAKMPDTCLEAIAIHEFGHALGMAHEQYNARNRPTPPPCSTGMDGPAPDDFVTNYDAGSIMNYCNPHWIEAKISCMDIVGAQIAYGPKAPRNCIIPGIDKVLAFGQIVGANPRLPDR